MDLNEAIKTLQGLDPSDVKIERSGDNPVIWTITFEGQTSAAAAAE